MTVSDALSAPAPDRDRRFGGIARLYGADSLARFGQAHVCVVGIGGVGSWVVEALARSGLGKLTLIDMDHVSESNINRQIHALDTTLGQAKVTAQAARVAQINAACRVTTVDEFVDPGNVARLLCGHGFDCVVDASDQVLAKVAMIVLCRDQGIPLVCVGAAGGQRDPTRVRLVDIAHTQHEPLLARVRKKLRAEHGYPRNIKAAFGVPAVYSDEPLLYPDSGPDTPGGPAGGPAGLNCAGFGSSVAVTAVFGMVAASAVLGGLARRPD